VLAEDFARERFDFTEGDGFKAIVGSILTFGALQPKGEATDTAE
jgi:hypothetical protein